MSPVLAAVAAVAVSGCATTSYCTGEFDYQKAQTLPPLEEVAGLELPQSQSALKVPPAPEDHVPYATIYKDEDGDERVRCLDMPQPLPPLPAEPPLDPSKAVD